MSRKYAVIAAILWFATSSRVFALGLGNIEIQSALSEPLRAVVGLMAASDEELDELKVNIASQQAFNQANIPRPQILSTFLFRVERTPTGKPVIRISTRDPIHEPFLDFLLEVVWTKGRLIRQYTVLIDPPYTMPATPIVPGVPVTSKPPAETPTPEPARVTSQPAPVPVRAVVPPPAETPATGADKYGPVRRNETLWMIAKRVRPGSDVSMDQMMLALQRANPGAFIHNNINNLKAGAVLAVPGRDEILSLSAANASRETRQQYSEWKSARTAPGTTAEPEGTSPPEPVATKTRLQLVAPETETGESTAAAGTPDDTVPADKAGNNALEQQLSMATEDAETNRAQSDELQTRVTELEGQVADMKRLLELKDAQLAGMQNRQSADDAATLEQSAGAESDQQPMASDAANAEAGATEPANDEKVAEPPVIEEPNGLVDRLLDNPVLAALGVIVAMILGGFLWASTRQRKQDDLFSDEPTLASRMAESRHDSESVTGIKPHIVAEPVNVGSLGTDETGFLDNDGEGDPLTEADVFIAYGRVQQAEDVIQAALQKSPEDMDLKVKLLEIYHAAGNAAAFDTHAEGVRRVIETDDPRWEKIAAMGYELSPDNPAYKSGSTGDAGPDVDFDMDLSGMDDAAHAGDATIDEDLGLDYADTGIAANDLPESIEFSLDERDDPAEGALLDEGETEGLLDSSDEVSTKLDLARAYIDMGDPDSARNILGEVLEEGNEEQKSEAENLFSQVS